MRKSIKSFVRERANGCCEYCLSQQAYSSDNFSTEHFIPVAAGGTDDLENLVFACQGCNNCKYTHQAALDPATGNHVPLFNPRSDIWASHFQWNEDCSLLLGISPTGRATIIRLQLNRSNVVNLRRALYQLGLHPATSM